MNEELLISIVQKYSELYNTEDSRYHDDQRRMNIWKEIGGMMNKNPITCKEKWKKIRENFRKATILRNSKRGQAAKNFKPIRYAKELSFLTPYILSSLESMTNLPPISSNDDEPSNFTSPPVTPTSPAASDSTNVSAKSINKKKKTEEIPASAQSLFQSDIEKEYCHNRQEEDDPIVFFFRNLGQTVKQFPPDLKVRVKRQVFNIVSEAEEELIQRNTAFQSNVQDSYPNQLG